METITTATLSRKQRQELEKRRTRRGTRAPEDSHQSLEVGRTVTRKPGAKACVLGPGLSLDTVSFFSRSEVDPQLQTLTSSPRSPSLELWMEGVCPPETQS